MRINVHSYFDESGDPGTRKSSSDHLILGGYAVYAAAEPQISEALATARAEFNYTAGRVFHFTELPHEKRLRFAQIVGALPITTFVVCICKRGGPSGGIKADMLYNWACRLVMERCSWACRDRGHLTSLTFEHMKGYQTAKMRTYVERLKEMPTEIKWDHLHTPIRFGAKATHEQLQVADCIASAAGLAMQPKYGLTEPRYLELLAPTLWRRNGVVAQYGVKVHPQVGMGTCGADHSWLSTL